MGGVSFADLFQRQRISQRIHPGSAIFLGDLNPHKAHLAHLFDGFIRKIARLIELCRDRGDLILGEIPGCLADHLMFFTQRKQSAICHGFLLSVSGQST